MQRNALCLLAVLVSITGCQTPPSPQVQLDPVPVYDGQVAPIAGRVIIRVEKIADAADYDVTSNIKVTTADGLHNNRDRVQGRITAFRNNRDVITEFAVERQNDRPLPKVAVINIHHDEFRNPTSVQTNVDAITSQRADVISALDGLKRWVMPLKPNGYAMNEVVYTQPVTSEEAQFTAVATCRLGGRTVYRGRTAYFLKCNGDGFSDTANGKMMISLDGYQIVDADTALTVASKIRLIGNGPAASLSGVESMIVALKENTASSQPANSPPTAGPSKGSTKTTSSRPPSATRR